MYFVRIVVHHDVGRVFGIVECGAFALRLFENSKGSFKTSSFGKQFPSSAARKRRRELRVQVSSKSKCLALLQTPLDPLRMSLNCSDLSTLGLLEAMGVGDTTPGLKSSQQQSAPARTQ